MTYVFTVNLSLCSCFAWASWAAYELALRATREVCIPEDRSSINDAPICHAGPAGDEPLPENRDEGGSSSGDSLHGGGHISCVTAVLQSHGNTAMALVFSITGHLIVAAVGPMVIGVVAKWGWSRDSSREEWHVVAAIGQALHIAAVEPVEPVDLGMAVGVIHMEWGWSRDSGWEEWRIVTAMGWALHVAAVKPIDPMDLGMAVVELTALGSQWRWHVPRAEVVHPRWVEQHGLLDEDNCRHGACSRIRDPMKRSGRGVERCMCVRLTEKAS
ncbi:hypothetical protein BJY52DRAFT_1227029 [Lactarius psammicola]|nr:hypothetical protein BJY52DRAFT_1227029 [Lactarius psammicola]